MRRMNSMLLGAPGRVGTDGLGVLADGQLRGGVVPGERQVDDARGDHDVVEIGDAALDGIQRGEQGLAGEEAAVVVDVEGADAGGDIDDAGEAFGAQAGFQGVDAEAQVEVEDVGAVFDEEVLVAVGTMDEQRGLGGGRGWDCELGPGAGAGAGHRGSLRSRG